MKRAISVSVFHTNEEADEANRGYWTRTLNPEERVQLAWDLSEQLWRMLGRYPDEHGLPRSTARVSRG